MVNINVSILFSENEENNASLDSQSNNIKIKHESEILRKKFCKTEIEGRCVIEEENEEDFENNEICFENEKSNNNNSIVENNKNSQINVFNINISHKKEKYISEKS